MAGAEEEEIQVLVIESAVAGGFLDLLLRFRMCRIEFGQDLVALFADLGALFFGVVAFGAEEAGCSGQGELLQNKAFWGLGYSF